MVRSQFGWVRFGSVWCGSVRLRLLWFDSVGFGLVQFTLVWFGAVWLGLALFSLVRLCHLDWVSIDLVWLR